MDAGSWSASISSTLKRYQSALQSRLSDMSMGFEDIEVDDNIRDEFQCSFCTNYHMQRKRKSRRGASISMLSLLRRELREATSQSHFGDSSYIVSSANAAPDPLLSSFILPMADDTESSGCKEKYK